MRLRRKNFYRTGVYQNTYIFETAKNGVPQNT